MKNYIYVPIFMVVGQTVSKSIKGQQTGRRICQHPFVYIKIFLIQFYEFSLLISNYFSKLILSVHFEKVSS